MTAGCAAVAAALSPTSRNERARGQDWAPRGDGILNDGAGFLKWYVLRQQPRSSPLKTDGNVMERINFEMTMSFSYLAFLSRAFHICGLCVLCMQLC